MHSPYQSKIVLPRGATLIICAATAACRCTHIRKCDQKTISRKYRAVNYGYEREGIGIPRVNIETAIYVVWMRVALLTVPTTSTMNNGTFICVQRALAHTRCLNSRFPATTAQTQKLLTCLMLTSMTQINITFDERISIRR